MNENKSSIPPVVWIIVVIALLCCCLAALLGIGGYAYSMMKDIAPSIPTLPSDFSTSIPTDNGDGGSPTDTPEPSAQLTRVPISDISTDTVKTLQESLVPVNDLRDLACRLHAQCNIPEVVPSGPFKVGDKQKFWVTNTDNAKSFQVDATLQYLTDHAYFWVEDNADYNADDAKKLVDTFENKIYPTDREFFGSEWTPGVDNDPHIYLLYAHGIGGSVAGYFSSPDEYSGDAHQYSNAHEMFVFNADNTFLGDQFAYGVLAHEFQHMIHWKQDRNETSWINEGFSEVAVLLNGYYGSAGNASLYINDTDVQLNDWDPNPSLNPPHYGAAFMFLAYFLDRFGKEATQQLVHDQINGMDSVDDVLTNIKATDAVTNQPIHADDFFMDWAATNYLLDSSVGDGRYAYQKYTGTSKASATTTITNCPDQLSGSVHQYGVDYIRISCSGKYTLHFEGDTLAKLLPVDPKSGKYAFWSNKGDESDMTLTHDFDFSKVSGPVTLQYQMWHDLEKDYDYVFVEASPMAAKPGKLSKPQVVPTQIHLAIRMAAATMARPTTGNKKKLT